MYAHHHAVSSELICESTTASAAAACEAGLPVGTFSIRSNTSSPSITWPNTVYLPAHYRSDVIDELRLGLPDLAFADSKISMTAGSRSACTDWALLQPEAM